MKDTKHNCRSPRRDIQKIGAGSAFILALGLLAGNVRAQVIVHDPGAVLSDHADYALSYAKQGLQYTKQLQEYATQLQQYQQMLSQIQGLTTGMSLLPNTLQHADAAPLIQADCAGASGGGLIGTALSSLASYISPSQPISQSQQQICATIITTQVDKYNKTVDMLNQLNTYSTMFSKVQQVGNTISTMADSGRANNQAAIYSSALTTQMANWDSQMRADDAIIKTLQDQQAILAKVALNGSGSSILSDAAPDTTFQTVINGIAQ